MDVHVSISAIIMCCDDSICKLVLGNGYIIKKYYFECLPFKDKIVDGRGMLSTDYFGSRLQDDGGAYFYCIEKQDEFQIHGPRFENGVKTLTDEDFMCHDELDSYMENEMSFLNERINLLRLFKNGNIGFRDVYFTFKFTAMGFMNNTVNNNSHNETRNLIEATKYSLSDEEAFKCNQWLTDYCGAVYSLIKNCVDEFSWGMEQIDIPTGFEQYTTALEMMLLPQNQPGKKQMLANRIAAMLGNNNTEIQQIHQNILDYYKYRSESLHDGDGTHITDVELRELEQITRSILCKCMERCKTEYCANSNITWDEVKTKIMAELVAKVQTLKNSGILPV